MTIIYANEKNLSAEEIIEIFDAADFPNASSRFDDYQVSKMIEYANVSITARDDAMLAGVALSMTNYSSACYLSAFAVHPDFRNQGIGRELIRVSHQTAGGEKVSMVSVATHEAVGFYESIGMERCRNAFMVPRIR